MHPIAQQLNTLKGELTSSYLEREEMIEACLLALLAGEHAFIIGPPGTSKSQLIRAITHSLTGASYFEAALSKTRPAEAVLGPLDLAEFRQTGNYFLKRKGFATDVDILFLDEVGKMSPVLGHDLLALLNERVYHEVNGHRSVHEAPLHAAFTASNEMPVNESDDAAALWDRLLIRVVVDYVKGKRDFAKVLTSTIDAPQTTISFADLKEAATKDVPAVPVTTEALKAIVNLRTRMNGEKMVVSDRRWRASIKVLKAAAFLAGDSEVREDHLSNLRFTLWETLEQYRTIRDMCDAAANPYAEKLQQIAKGLKEVSKEMKQRLATGDDNAIRDYASDAANKLKVAHATMTELVAVSGGRTVPGLDESMKSLYELTVRHLTDFMGVDQDIAEATALKRTSLPGYSAGPVVSID